MITASQLRTGTKFSASGIAGIYRKVRDEGDKIVASMVFGPSAEEVGKETTIDGSMPCFILNSQRKDNNKAKNHKTTSNKVVGSNVGSENISVSIVTQPDTIIYTNDKPSPSFIAAIGNSDSLKYDGKKYDVTDVAFDINYQTLYIVVE